jgi:ParB/RepB/Spo0J family partition protein
MTDQTNDADQMMLMHLPQAHPDKPIAVDVPAKGKPLPAPVSTSTSKALGTLDTLLALIPDAVKGVMLVDPRIITIDPVNVRHGMRFDPAVRGELIESMRGVGNTVLVRLRRDPNGGSGFLCFSGSQRWGSAMHIQQDDPGFRLRAIIADTMTDKEAFEIAEADNAGRSGVTPMQQARQWATMLEQVYAGNRQEFIAATGRSASIVSRTLALLTLPDYVRACCSDVEALTPYFAERLVPRLADSAEEPAIRRRADALIATGRCLPGPRLVQALLVDSATQNTTPSVADSPLWSSPDGARRLIFKPDRKGGGRIDVIGASAFSNDERRAALKALEAQLKALGTAV